MSEAGGEKKNNVQGKKRELPDHSTKVRSEPCSFGPLAKKNSNTRYATGSQTVVNHRALLVDCTASPTKHSVL